MLAHGYMETTSNQGRVVPSTSYVPSRQKRSYEEDEEMEVQPQKQKETHAGALKAPQLIIYNAGKVCLENP